MKEQQPHGITELEQKLGNIDGALGKANRVIQTIGTPVFGRPELDISPSSQLEGVRYLDAAIKVGKVRKALADNALPKLTDLKNQVQTQISDSKPQEEAEKLRLIHELVDAGHIPATVLERSQESTGVKKTNNDIADRSQNREVISGDAVEEGFVVGKRIKYLNAVDLFVRTPEITLEEIIRVLPLAPNQQPASYARAYADMSMTIFGIYKRATNGSATLQELVILKRIKERIAGKSPMPVDEAGLSRIFNSRVTISDWLESEVKPKGPPPPKKDTRSEAARKVDADVERLRKQGLKNSEIALELGIELKKVEPSAARLIAAGRIERRSPKRGEVTDVVAKRDAQIIQLINEGLNNKTVSQRLAVSEATVTTAVQRLVATGRIERNAQQDKIKRDKDTLENALVRHLSENPKKAVPLAELAREVGINSSRTFNLYQQIAKEKKVPLLRLGRPRTR